MENELSISKRTKNLITHITSGLTERNESMSLALLSCIAGENFCFYGPQGTGKNTMLKKLKSAFSERVATKIKIYETPSETQILSSEWEEFLLHLSVNQIQDSQAFLKLITAKKTDSQIVKADDAISAEELKTWDSQIEDIKMPPEIQAILSSIRQKLNEINFESDESEKSENFYISDSRWIKIARLLKTSAFLNGRKAVDFMDCELISHCIWKIKKKSAETNNTVQEVTKIVEESIMQAKNPFDDELSALEKQIQEFADFAENAFYIEENGKKIKSPALFGYTKPAEPNTFRMNDGTIAFRFMHPSEIRSYDYITPYYISKEFSQYEDGKGAYFDENRNRIAKNDRYRDKYFVKDLKIANGNAVWTDGDFKQEFSMRVQMIPENFVKGNEAKLAELKNHADEKYTAAAQSIKKLSEKIQKYIRGRERQFKANIFAKKSTAGELLAKFSSATEKISQMSERLAEISQN